VGPNYSVRLLETEYLGAVGMADAATRERVVALCEDRSPWTHHATTISTAIFSTLRRLRLNRPTSVAVTMRPSATGVWFELDAGAGFEPWYEVGDFSCSKPNDRHVILDGEAALVRFGDGEHGWMPPVGAAVRGWYRIGAGAAGDLPSSCGELVVRLAEVSHFSWMRQKAHDEHNVMYEELDPTPTKHDRERAEDALAELERLGLLRLRRYRYRPPNSLH
jgi:hypothetical protein